MPDQKTTDTIASALSAYDLGGVREIVALPGEHGNRPHVVTTEAGRVFVKLLAPRLASPTVVQLRHAFVGHLAAEGVLVPRFVKTRTGEGMAREGGSTIEVQEYVDGQPLRADDPEDARRAGEALARLHLAGTDFTPSGPTSRDALSIDEDLERLRRMEQQMQTYLPAPEVLQSVEDVRRALITAAHTLAEADLPTGMTHGSFGPDNLLRDQAGEVWITGFDACQEAPLLLDVATAAAAFGRAGPSADAVVDGYEGVRALSDEEKRFVGAAQTRVLVHLGLERGESVQRISQEVAASRLV